MAPLAVLALLAIAAPPTELPAGEEPLVDVSAIDRRWLIDLPYATADNFFGQKVYPISLCALRTSVAEKMRLAQQWLDHHQSGLRLLFKDCYRPDRVQHVMWAVVKGTPKAGYVADPTTTTGSIHSYGAAVDVTLADAGGKELDLGTPHDFLGKLAEPRLEARFLAEGKLTQQQIDRRHLLRDAMLAAGMKTIPNEWWHFNDGEAAEVRKKFRRLDVPLESVAVKKEERPRPRPRLTSTST